MKTIKIISVVAVLVAIGVASFMAVAEDAAQKTPPVVGSGLLESLPAMLMGHVKDRLKLTDEQEATLTPILKEIAQKRHTKLETLHTAVQEQVQAAQAEREAAWQDLEKRLAEILTPEQMQEVATMRTEMQGNVQNFRQRLTDRQANVGEFRQMVQDLNLTADQKRQLFAIVMKKRANRQAVVQDVQATRQNVATLAQEMLNSEFDEQKVRELYRKTTADLEENVVAAAKMLAEMKTVLTPEQVKLLQEKGVELLNRTPGKMPQRHAFFRHFGK